MDIFNSCKYIFCIFAIVNHASYSLPLKNYYQLNFIIMSSQHLSDYEKQLLADPTYTCIVKVKGVGAGAHTVTPILKTVFAKMQKEYNEGGGIREVGDWQEIGSNAILKQDKVYVPVKTPQEILDEAMGLVQQSTPKVAEEVVTKKSEAKATK